MKKRDAKDFVIQRKNIEGHLSAPLNLRIWKKIGICGITMGLALSLTGCRIDLLTGDIEIGDYETGFRLNNAYSNEDVKYVTEEYSLIKLDGKIYVAYTFSSINSKTGNLISRYYDIKDKKFLGMSLVEPKIDDLDGEHTSFDYLYFNGNYKMGCILPFGSVINLSEVVTSSYPSEQDLAFWSGNTEETHKRFNDFLFKDITSAIRNLGNGTNNDETKQVEYSTNITAQIFTCTKDNGKIDIIIGYRASENENDIGYNYVYDVITGTITYIGKSKEYAYIDVTVDKAPTGFTIKQIADKYDIEIVYTVNKEKKSTASNEQTTDTKNTNALSQEEQLNTENSDMSSQSEQPNIENSDELPQEGQTGVDSSNIETPEEKYYKNGEIMILDVKALKETGAVEYCEDDDIDYVILLEGEKYGLERALIDLMDDGSFAHQTADPTTIYYGNSTLKIHIKTIPQAKTIYTPSSLLKERGEADAAQSEYSLKELIKLYEKINPRKKAYVSKDKIKMFDTSSVNGTAGWVLVEERINGSGTGPYYCNPFHPEFQLRLIGDFVYYREGDDNSSEQLKNTSVVTLEEYLNEIGRTDLLKDKYTQSELISLSEALEEQKVEHQKAM